MKGPKKPTGGFKPGIDLKSTKGAVFGQNSAALITPKTKPSTSSGTTLSKHYSVPGTSTSQIDDVDTKTKDTSKPGTAK